MKLPLTMYRAGRKRKHADPKVALTILLIAAAGVGCAIWLGGGASASTARAEFVLPSEVAYRVVPKNLRPLVSRIRPHAVAAVADKRTTLGKVIALEQVVHTAVRPTGATCFGYATVMVALGAELDLPVRIVAVAASPSHFDSHTTVSVWLKRYGRWGIVDPTFGGTFTRGPHARPLGAVDLQRALVHGWWRQVRWHPSAPDSTPLSSYYVNPLFLFRYIGIYGDVAGSVVTLALAHADGLPGSNLAIWPRAAGTTRPNRAIRVHRLAQAPMAVTLPPAYAPRRIWQGRVELSKTIAVPKGSIVIWTSTPAARIAGYATFPAHRGSLSPMFTSDGKVRVTGHGTTTIRVFRVRRFNKP